MPITKSDILDNPGLMHMLYWCVKLLKVPPHIKDDVMQETILNICNRSICPEISVARNIVNHMRWVLMGRNTKKTLRRQIKLQTNVSFIPENSYLEDEHFEIKEELKAATQVLTSIEKKVLHMYFYEEKTLEEIGKTFSLSKERIRQIKKQAIEICKERVNG